MTEQRSKGHHTVPRYYLQGFADNRNRIMRVVLPGSRRHLESVKSATVVNDFYTLSDSEGQPSDAYEQWLATVESAAIPAFKAILQENRWPLPRDLKLALAQWAAVQYLRTPMHRQTLDETKNFLAKLHVGINGKAKLKSDMQIAFGRDVTDDEVNRQWQWFTRPEGPDLKVSTLDHVESINALAGGTGAMFADKSWSLLRFERRRLVTSDNPVTLVPDLHRPQDSVGLINAEHIMLSLDRRTAIIMAQLFGPDIEMPASTHFAKYVNTIVALGAHRVIYHHPDDDPLRRIDLRDPHERQMENPDIEDFIREEGLFTAGHQAQSVRFMPPD
jgi:hypothetical protein